MLTRHADSDTKGFHVGTESTLIRFRACQQKPHLAQTPSNEKEIRFPIRIFQTPPLNRRFALLRSDHTRSVCAAPNALRAIGADSQPIVRAQYLGVMPVVKFDISPPLRSMKPLPVKGMHTARERRGGADSAGPVGPVVPDTAVQRVMGKIGIPAPIISFDGNQQPLRLLSAGPQWRGWSQSCCHDGQSAFSNL